MASRQSMMNDGDGKSDAAVLVRATAVKKRLRDLWRGEYVKLGIHKFFASYLGTGLLAIIIPAWKYHFEKRAYQQSSQYYNYMYGVNYVYDDDHNNGGDDDEEEQILPWFDIHHCTWWKLRCHPLWINTNGLYRDQVAAAEEEEGGEEEMTTYYHEIPNWFSGWGNVNNGGGSTTDFYANEGSLTDSKQLKFVYWWQLLIFLCLLFYGPWIISKESAAQGGSTYGVHTLFLLILLWTNFSFLNMWTLANGAIYTQGPAIDEVGGFYCQFSVLMFMTNFWYFIWGCIFSPLLLRECMLSRKGSSSRGHRRSRSRSGRSIAQTLSSDSYTTRGRPKSRGPSSSSRGESFSPGRGESLSPGRVQQEGGYFPPHISAFMADPRNLGCAGGSYLPYPEPTTTMTAYKPRSEPSMNANRSTSPQTAYGVNGMVPPGVFPHVSNAPRQMQAAARSNPPSSPHSHHSHHSPRSPQREAAITQGVDVDDAY